MYSALSRIMKNTFEDRDRRREVRSSGFSMSAPITLESRPRKWVREAGNRSQRMNRRFPPKLRLTRLLWSTFRATDVFPIPPAPIRATGVTFSARLTILSISPSRPKQALGGGGNSPGGIPHKHKTVNSEYSGFLTWFGSGEWSVLCCRRIESRTYEGTVASGTTLTCWHMTMHIRNHHVGVNCQLGLKGKWLAIAGKNWLNIG